jgi:hypothetical protein
VTTATLELRCTVVLDLRCARLTSRTCRHRTSVGGEQSWSFVAMLLTRRGRATPFTCLEPLLFALLRSSVMSVPLRSRFSAGSVEAASREVGCHR